MAKTMTTQGKRLKKIRKELELSQEKMGEYFDLSKQYWSNFENDRDTLNNEKLVKLIQYFNVNINYVLIGKGNMFLPDENEEQALWSEQKKDFVEQGYWDENRFWRKKEV